VAEQLRALLEQPLDPRAARAATVLAAALLIGFATVVGLGTSSGVRHSVSGRLGTPIVVPAPTPTAAGALPTAPRRRAARPGQDPQDNPGSDDATRARHELATHRALQQVPYRKGAVRIALVGASGSVALLRVEAPSRATARHGWRDFLRRYRDDGRAYVARFEVRGDAGG
jgi:hypothetical protein